MQLQRLDTNSDIAGSNKHIAEFPEDIQSLISVELQESAWKSLLKFN